MPLSTNFIVRANTAEEEIELVWEKLEMMEFFQKYNYTLSLPKHPIMAELTQKSLKNSLTDEDKLNLSKLIQDVIYKESDYAEGIRAVKNSLTANKLDFTFLQEYHECWNFKLFEEVKILLTQYGPGGQYNPYTSTIIMLTTPSGMFRRGSNPLDTIIHELVHMGLEEAIIQKYSIPHHLKEQIVDLFVQQHFQEILPNYPQQNFGENKIEKFLQCKEDWLQLPSRIIAFQKMIKLF